MDKKVVSVSNMTCASCAASVQRFLENQVGVSHAEVNFATEKATIEFTDATSFETLKTAVSSIGFDLVALDSEDAKLKVEQQKSSIFKRMKKNLIGASIFAIPLFIIGMFFMGIPYADYIMWALSTPLVFYFGRSFFVGAWKQLKNRSANMDSLVALSTGIAYFFSVFTTLYPAFWHTRGMHVHVYFEAAGIVVAFVLLGKFLEEKAKGNTSSALKKLIGLQPKTALIVENDQNHHEIPIQNILKGMIVLVKPGERIAVDGTVVNGNSYVDESTISGESLPIKKVVGEKVYAGTMNQKGSFQFVAEKVGSETVLAQIISMVELAQGSKAPVQKVVDKIARIFVPTIILIAFVSFLAWCFWGGEQGLEHGIVAALTVLIIACPCALGLATPTAIMVGIGRAAERGVLIKDAEGLELAQKIDTIVLDKTGTITKGEPWVDELNWFVPNDPTLRSILFTMEKSSEHPLADAIVFFLTEDNTFLNELSVENITGQGILGHYHSKKYFIGNELLLKQEGLQLSLLQQQWFDQQSSLARTVVLFFDDSQVLAGISISDQIKDNSKKAIALLQELGISCELLTGDREQVTKAVANEVGIKIYKSNVLPAEKSAYVAHLQEKGSIVAMVGDGVNDSAALAQADVSIAMGKGSDIAKEVATMTIVSSDLLKIAEAIKISKLTSKAIRQNLFWAFIYNIIGIPIAAGVLYPINGFLLNPMWAGAAMAFSSVSVVANSILMNRKEIFKK